MGTPRRRPESRGEQLPGHARPPSVAAPRAAGLATVDGQLFLLDGQGDRLPLISGVQPTTLAYLEQRLLDPKGKPDMVLGRLQDRDATLYLRPLAATVAAGQRHLASSTRGLWRCSRMLLTCVA